MHQARDRDGPGWAAAAGSGSAIRVTGMRILVTGAGSGVGRATAALLAGRGHEVIATARDRATLDELEVATRLHLDVADATSVDEVHRELGWVDALVNNAAISFRGPIEHVAVEHVREMFETNVLGPVRLIQAFVPGMRERRSGVVVNISSVAGHVAQPLSGYYAATKHALEAISEALYVELAHFGVRVVVVEPGFIAPGMKEHSSSCRTCRLRRSRRPAGRGRTQDAGRRTPRPGPCRERGRGCHRK